MTSRSLPLLLRKYLDMTSANHSYIFGDFNICPVEADTPGRLRRVCVAGGTKFVIQPLVGSQPPFRRAIDVALGGRRDAGRAALDGLPRPAQHGRTHHQTGKAVRV